MSGDVVTWAIAALILFAVLLLLSPPPRRGHAGRGVVTKMPKAPLGPGAGYGSRATPTGPLPRVVPPPPKGPACISPTPDKITVIEHRDANGVLTGTETKIEKGGQR